jgi:hypothetical protein
MKSSLNTRAVLSDALRAAPLVAAGLAIALAARPEKL